MIRAAILVLVTALVAVAAYVVPHSQNGAKSPHVGLIYAYYPPPGLFCLHSVRDVVQSDGSYENNLIGGATDFPLPDTDFMLPSGRQEHVCLPGTKYDHYYYLGSVFVSGSGCLQEFQAEGGGRFALLHMDCRFASVPAPTFAVIGPQPPQAGPLVPFRVGAKTMQDATYASVPSTPRVGGVALSYHGGRYVGWSRWPTSYQYSFGSCWDDYSCRADAHLCLLMDERAAQWFYRVANHQDHRGPKPKFNLKRWNEFRVQYHLEVISPYYKKHLSWIASVWWPKHVNLYGIRSSHYYGKKHGYTQDNFRFGTIRCWPSYHACRVSSHR